jgi:hypothetical protein
MAFVTIDVLVLGEALGEVPEFADVVCACHGIEIVDRIKTRVPAVMLDTYIARVDAELSC